MFQWRRKQVLPVVGITVPQEWYDAVVKERDTLKAQVSNQAQVITSLVNRQTELKQELEEEKQTNQEAYEDCYKMQERIKELTQELAEWKAKAQHRKAPRSKAVTPE
jgi:chromosome segregation ATPase